MPIENIFLLLSRVVFMAKHIIHPITDHYSFPDANSISQCKLYYFLTSICWLIIFTQDEALRRKEAEIRTLTEEGSALKRKVTDLEHERMQLQVTRALCEGKVFICYTAQPKSWTTAKSSLEKFIRIKTIKLTCHPNELLFQMHFTKWFL